MTRPTPKKSALAGANALTSTTMDTPPPVTKISEPETKKVGFYQRTEDAERMRAALFYTAHEEGPRTLSDFINAAVLKEVVRLEEKYNASQPWPPVSAGKLPKGRPLQY